MKSIHLDLIWEGPKNYTPEDDYADLDGEYGVYILARGKHFAIGYPKVNPQTRHRLFYIGAGDIGQSLSRHFMDDDILDPCLQKNIECYDEFSLKVWYVKIKECVDYRDLEYFVREELLKSFKKMFLAFPRCNNQPSLEEGLFRVGLSEQSSEIFHELQDL